MEFIFVCPVTHQTFQTDAFTIIENRGVRTDQNGAKQLDAKVRVDIDCPFCAEKLYTGPKSWYVRLKQVRDVGLSDTEPAG